MREMNIADPLEFLLELQEFIEDRGGSLELDKLTNTISCTHRITVDTRNKVIEILSGARSELIESNVYGAQSLIDAVTRAEDYFRSNPINKLNLVH